jgi:hypothetical protein
VLNSAEADVLLVDARADAAALTDYAVLTPERVAVRLLAGQGEQEATLRQAAQNWQQRFGDERPLSIRLAAADTLEDQLIVADNATAWILGASFSDLAKDKRTTLMRMPATAAPAKIEAYAALWETAEPLEAE